MLEFDSSSAGEGMTNSTVLYWTLGFINSVIKNPEFGICYFLILSPLKIVVTQTSGTGQNLMLWKSITQTNHVLELKAMDFTYFYFLSYFYFLLFPFSTIFYFGT